MKVVTLLLSLIAAVSATPAPAEAIGQADPSPSSTKNGEMILPRLSTQKPANGTTRTTLKYGTYLVSSAKMMSTTRLNNPNPCSKCYVTAMEATIRYPNGKEANTDTGAWLHHIALFGTGAGGLSIWAAGNERPTLRLNNGDKKFGIQWPGTFVMLIDLMSEDIKAKNLTLEITYEHIAMNSPFQYKPVSMHWLTVGSPMARGGKYSFNTLPATTTVSGPLLYAIGHMHDGGTDMTLSVNGKIVCKSIMHYNAREGYGGQGAASGSTAKMSGGHSHRMIKRDGGHGGSQHISDPGACINFGTVNKLDKLVATANYDANKYKLMEHNGAKESLMGNMRVYIGIQDGAAPSLTTGGKGILGGLFG